MQQRAHLGIRQTVIFGKRWSPYVMLLHCHIIYVHDNSHTRSRYTDDNQTIHYIPSSQLTETLTLFFNMVGNPGFGWQTRLILSSPRLCTSHGHRHANQPHVWKLAHMHLCQLIATVTAYFVAWSISSSVYTHTRITFASLSTYTSDFLHCSQMVESPTQHNGSAPKALGPRTSWILANHAGKRKIYYI